MSLLPDFKRIGAALHVSLFGHPVNHAPWTFHHPDGRKIEAKKNHARMLLKMKRKLWLLPLLIAVSAGAQFPVTPTSVKITSVTIPGGIPVVCSNCSGGGGGGGGNTGSYTVTPGTGTFPISAVNLPLPTGAAQDSTLTGGTVRAGVTQAGPFGISNTTFSIVNSSVNVGGSTVTVVAAPGATFAVTGTFFQATQPASIATPLSVSASSAIPVSGTFFQATQPVSVSLPLSVSASSAIPVSGTFYQATQPISVASPVSVSASSAIPTTVTNPISISASSAVPVSGTFYQATQPVSVALPLSVSASSAIPVSGTFFQTTQPVSVATPLSVSASSAIPVSGTFFPATQPVSVAAPLSISASSAVPVSIATPLSVSASSAIPVSGTFFQGTQPVSVATPLSISASSAVPVSGTFYQTTQPVSFSTGGANGSTTVVVNAYGASFVVNFASAQPITVSAPLSVSASSALPVSIALPLSVSASSAIPVSVSAPLSVSASSAIPVSGTFFQGTQPISIALPISVSASSAIPVSLPTGTNNIGTVSGSSVAVFSVAGTTLAVSADNGGKKSYYITTSTISLRVAVGSQTVVSVWHPNTVTSKAQLLRFEVNYIPNGAGGASVSALEIWPISAQQTGGVAITPGKLDNGDPATSVVVSSIPTLAATLVGTIPIWSTLLPLASTQTALTTDGFVGRLTPGKLPVLRASQAEGWAITWRNLAAIQGLPYLLTTFWWTEE